MKTLVWAVFFGVFAILIWTLLLHPLLHRWQVTHNLFEILDAREAGMGSRLRVALSGLKRKLFARLVWIFGLMATIHELVLPHLTTIQPLFPEKYRVYLYPAMTLLGVVFEVLSRISVQPVDEVNPEVLAGSTNQSLRTVAQITRDDPLVALPSQDQITKAEGIERAEMKA